MERIFLIVLLVFCTVQVQCSEEDADEEIKNLTMACMEKEQVGVLDVLGLAFKGPAVSDEDNKKLKCVVACMLEDSGLMNGCSVVYDSSKAKFSDEKEKEEAYSLMKNCTARFLSEDRCECAYQMTTCMSEFLTARDDEN